MPKIRMLCYLGEQWRLSDLARAHGLLPQTLARRLSSMPMERALHAPLVSRREAGRRGYVASSWREE